MSTLFGTRRRADSVPLRGEITSLESLEELARTLAAVFTLAREPRGGRHDVLAQCDRNLALLKRAYLVLADDVRRAAVVDPAAEWLLDNFHLLDAQVRELRRDLPMRFYRRLPRLAAREYAGQARIYSLAIELIRHGEGRLDAERLSRFLFAYQSVAPLTLGELWAWPLMLKLALLENLRSLTEGVLRGRDARLAAEAALARLEQGSTLPPLPTPLHSAFVAQSRQRMLEHDPRVAALHVAIEAALARRGTTSDDVVRSEHQRQATDQAAAGNTFSSLRLCASLDWSRFVERQSQVDQILRRDPSGDYPRMDFASRDGYRHAVEELAENSGEAQVRVALRAVESARLAAARDPHGVAAHVGHHLCGSGRADLETDVAYRPPLALRLRRLALRHATAVYLGGIGASTALVVAAAAAYARAVGAPESMGVAVLYAAIPASELAVLLVQRVVAARVAP
ncbi:MAG: carbohydrate-binding protein, partial [Planctomycetota bacterium]